MPNPPPRKNIFGDYDGEKTPWIHLHFSVTNPRVWVFLVWKEESSSVGRLSMSKMRLVLAFALVMGFAGAFWIITPNMPQVLAQGTITGEWKASVNKDNSK